MKKFYYYLRLLALLLSLTSVLTFKLPAAFADALIDSNFFVVSTDLEPDDLHFLGQFQRKLKLKNQVTEVYFIVGRGDPFIKKARLQKYIRSWNLPENIHTTILLSFSSDDGNKDDGKDCLSTEELTAIAGILPDDGKIEYLQSKKILLTALQTHTEGVLIIIKPLDAELDIFNSRQISLKKYHLIIYEGWNLKSTITHKEGDVSHIHQTNLHSIQQFFRLFDSPPMVLSNFSILEKNGFPREISNSNDASREVISHIEQSSDVYTGFVRNFTLIWNLKMLRKFSGKVLGKAHRLVELGFLQGEIDRLRELDNLYSAQFPTDEQLRAGFEIITNFNLYFKNLIASQKDEQVKSQLDAIFKSLGVHIYDSIASCPKVQFTVADYHAFIALNSAEYYEWAEIQSIFEMDEASRNFGFLREKNSTDDLGQSFKLRVARNLSNGISKDSSLTEVEQWERFIHPLKGQ